MMKKIVVLLLPIALLFSCNQSIKPPKETAEIESIHSIRNYEYADASGKKVSIQNSLPKGDSYTAPNGKKYFRVLFWTNIQNETDQSLEFTIAFPAPFKEVLKSPDNFYKVFIANDTMSSEKEAMYNYGFTGVSTFLDVTIDQPTALKRTVPANASTGFYVVILSYYINTPSNSVLRTGFYLKGQDIIHKISRYTDKSTHPLLGEEEVICGRINLKNLMRK